jgi:calnexin
MEGDKGLVVKNAAAHHAISAKFPKKIENKGKTLVVQYEVKLQSESKFMSIVSNSWLIPN